MSQARCEVFEARDGRWYWTLVAANNEPIAQCSENGYPDRRGAVRAYRAAQRNAAVAPVVVVE